MLVLTEVCDIDQMIDIGGPSVLIDNTKSRKATYDATFAFLALLHAPSLLRIAFRLTGRSNNNPSSHADAVSRRSGASMCTLLMAVGVLCCLKIEIAADKCLAADPRRM